MGSETRLGVDFAEIYGEADLDRCAWQVPLSWCESCSDIWGTTASALC